MRCVSETVWKIGGRFVIMDTRNNTSGCLDQMSPFTWSIIHREKSPSKKRNCFWLFLLFRIPDEIFKAGSSAVSRLISLEHRSPFSERKSSRTREIDRKLRPERRPIYHDDHCDRSRCADVQLKLMRWAFTVGYQEIRSIRRIPSSAGISPALIELSHDTARVVSCIISSPRPDVD